MSTGGVPSAQKTGGCREIGPWWQSLLPGIPGRSTLQPRRADLHHGYELVRARGGYITERGREGQDVEKGGQTTRGSLSRAAFHPQSSLAGGSSDTHNNHNNGILASNSRTTSAHRYRPQDRLHCPFLLKRALAGG